MCYIEELKRGVADQRLPPNLCYVSKVITFEVLGDA